MIDEPETPGSELGDTVVPPAGDPPDVAPAEVPTAEDMIPLPVDEPPVDGAVVEIVGVDDEPPAADDGAETLDAGAVGVPDAPEAELEVAATALDDEPSEEGAAVVEQSPAVEEELAAETASSEEGAEVAPISAADIPALEGCDVEKSWSGDETCEGTEAIEEAEAASATAPEADSDLEPAEGELAPDAAEAAIAEQAAHSAPSWPFIVYLVLWAALSVLAVWQLSQIPVGDAMTASEAYRIAVIGGVVMTVAGPALILAVFLASWFRAGDRSKTGLLASSLLKGSVATLLGVVMWWGTFLIVDQLRFGRFM